jgi:SNF2-related domain
MASPTRRRTRAVASSWPCAVADRRFEPPSDRGAAPVVVASLAAARRDWLRAELAAVGWDLVVADEAHRLKNARSASARLARSLSARYRPLLTATPIENRPSDLFQLVSLIRPGLLGSAGEFRAATGAATGPQCATCPRCSLPCVN